MTFVSLDLTRQEALAVLALIQSTHDRRGTIPERVRVVGHRLALDYARARRERGPSSSAGSDHSHVEPVSAAGSVVATVAAPRRPSPDPAPLPVGGILPPGWSIW